MRLPIADLAAVVAVTDDGGSSGRLRHDYRILPPGDIRNCLIALSQDEALLGRLFQYRFPAGGGLRGHSFGNLFLTALTSVTGDFTERCGSPADCSRRTALCATIPAGWRGCCSASSSRAVQVPEPPADFSSFFSSSAFIAKLPALRPKACCSYTEPRLPERPTKAASPELAGEKRTAACR